MAANRFEGRVAAITGGASGIGLAAARRLVGEGASVVVADLDSDALEAAASELGEAAHPVRVDVRIEAQVEAMVRSAVDRFGALDLAVNAAGVGSFGPITELAEEDWDFTLDICLKGVFLAVKHEARQMLAQERGGAIVNVASLNSHVPLPNGGAYACAKAGVEMLGRNAALELSDRGVRVNTVSPGLTDTPLTQPLREVPGVYDAYFERIPMRRAGSPDEMAAATLFLLSDDASYISGSNLVVDGAWETTGYPDLRPFAEKLMEKM